MTHERFPYKPFGDAIPLFRISRPYNNNTDETLIPLIADGDESAFAEIYDRYSERLLHFFYRMLHGDEQRAQDFLQDIAIKLIEKAHTFRGESRFSTWIFTVASNMCRNEFRKTNRSTTTAHDQLDRRIHPDPGVEDRMVDGAFATLLAEALKILEPEKREVFVLRFQEELSVREISDIVGCPEGTVKSRLFHATRKIGERLAPYKEKFFEV